MNLADHHLDGLRILADGPAAQGKTTSAEYRVISHPTISKLALHGLAEPTGGSDLFHRPLWKITAAGRDHLSTLTPGRTDP